MAVLENWAWRLLLYPPAPIALALTGVLDTGRTSERFMVSSREITPKHLLLKYVVIYYQLLSFLFMLEQGHCIGFWSYICRWIIFNYSINITLLISFKSNKGVLWNKCYGKYSCVQWIANHCSRGKPGSFKPLKAAPCRGRASWGCTQRALGRGAAPGLQGTGTHGCS